MSELKRLIDQIARTVDCTISAPRGQPALRSSERLPGDLAEFYQLCGGVDFFQRAAYRVRIVGPEELVRANPELVGQDCPDDISDAWYIVGRAGAEAAISIDCSAERLGRCYDSFWDCHGVAGDCRIVALSFTELLRRLLNGGGSYWYWLAEDGPGHGDAYDDVGSQPRDQRKGP